MLKSQRSFIYLEINIAARILLCVADPDEMKLEGIGLSTGILYYCLHCILMLGAGGTASQ